HSEDSVPSREMKAIVQEAAKRVPHSTLLTVNVNDEPDAASRMHVPRVPAVVLVSKSVELGRFEGVQSVDKIVTAARASLDKVDRLPSNVAQLTSGSETHSAIVLPNTAKVKVDEKFDTPLGTITLL